MNAAASEEAQPPEAPDSRRDERLVRLLDELTRDYRHGRHPDLDRVAKEHPELADDLRELWGAVLVSEEVARSSEADNLTGSADTLPSPATGTGSSLSVQNPPERIGDFEIVRELGRGGMGVVYEARQASLDRRVALKILLRRELSAGEDIARFRTEAESAARLDHPGIVGVFDVGSHDGMPFFTMRYVEGDTLRDRLARGPLPSREAVRLMAPVCRAIHHAHQNGVLHRDIKPSNILIDRGDNPLVADFGLAKRLEADDSLTKSGAVLGTPGYMAPEQAAGSRGEVGPASDVYSLGAVLYHALTGRPPFQAANPVDTILAVLEQDPLPPRLLDPAIDRDLEMIVLKCLQKPPELRYRDADELAKDLEAYLRGDPISVRTVSLPLLFSRLFRTTHHAAVLENWGLLWMWHSLALVFLCGLTNAMWWWDIEEPLAYLGLWTVGFGAWSAIFWSLRRRGGPITFVERQIAHIWGASIIGSSSLFLIEILLNRPVLSLAPVLPLFGVAVFMAKAAVLSGRFYVQAGVFLATSFVMAYLQSVGQTWGVLLFGLVSALCFFIPGLKYYRQVARKK